MYNLSVSFYWELDRKSGRLVRGSEGQADSHGIKRISQGSRKLVRDQEGQPEVLKVS